MLALATVTSVVGVQFLGALGAALGALAANGIAVTIATALVFRAVRPRIDPLMLIRLAARDRARLLRSLWPCRHKAFFWWRSWRCGRGLLLALLLVLRVVNAAELEPYLRPLLKRFAPKRSV